MCYLKSIIKNHENQKYINVIVWTLQSFIFSFQKDLNDLFILNSMI